MVHKENKTRAFFEQLVVAAIILVLIHTLVEDIAGMYGWSWNARKTLIYIGLFFDLFFTIEFVLRFLGSLFRRDLIGYIRNRRGWVDFVASVPLLLFNSGPAALSAFTGVDTLISSAGVFGVLKVVKAIRIARALRLLRFLKIFSHIRHVDSVMAQRHLTRVSTTLVTVIIAVLISFSFLSTALDFPTLEEKFEEYTVEALNERVGPNLTSEQITELATLRPDILIFRQNNETRFARYDNEYFARYYGPSDYTHLTYQNGEIECFVDLRPLNADAASTDLLHFIIIILIILSILFVYGPHFAATISDPSQVMRRGMREKGYNLRVLINTRYQNDEIFSLAEQYNENFLPIKNRQESSDESSDIADFDFDDVKKFLDQE